MFNPAIAHAYYDTYDPDELEQIRKDCLEVHQNSGTVQRHFEGGSLTIDPKNCEVILENVQEALRMARAGKCGADPYLSQPSFSVGLDFRTRKLT